MVTVLLESSMVRSALLEYNYIQIRVSLNYTVMLA